MPAVISPLHLKLAQLNPIVGNVAYNCDKLIALYQKCCAQSSDCDLIITTELYLSGYPAEDLYQHPLLLSEIDQALSRLAEATCSHRLGLLVGAPGYCLPAQDQAKEDSQRGFTRIGNMAFLIADGKIQARIQKYQLPSYGIFDDQRLFIPAKSETLQPVPFRGWSLGIMICEDMWFKCPSDLLAAQGADCLISLNASPFNPQKQSIRLQPSQTQSPRNEPTAYICQSNWWAG